ncbi:ankyrin domain protein [Nannochloropsis oceanica]
MKPPTTAPYAQHSFSENLQSLSSGSGMNGQQEEEEEEDDLSGSYSDVEEDDELDLSGFQQEAAAGGKGEATADDGAHSLLRSSTSSSSIFPKPSKTKRGVTISGAHTVAMRPAGAAGGGRGGRGGEPALGQGHHPSFSLTGMPLGLSQELVEELTTPDLKSSLVRRAQSLPRLEESKDKRLLHAVKNQQRWLAALRRSKSTVDVLVHEKDTDGRTPLHYAARWGDMEVVKTLIARGADVGAGDIHGHTPADEAEYWGHALVRDHLRGLELGKDTMERVVEAGDVRGLKELLLRGTHIKGEGYCLLHKAAKKGDMAMLRMLLAAGLGGELPVRDEEGHTAAEVALMSGHLKAFEMLVARSRSKMQTGKEEEVEDGDTGMDEEGMPPPKTPLHAAAECGSLEAVLRYGREWPVDSLDAELNTPLHCAIRYSHAAAARALVHDLKADVNKRNRWGTTPLAEAVRLGNDEIADMLRDHGACLFLEIDSQQVVIEPRDQYFLRLELATSLLFWAAVSPRPSFVRFFHSTHHNSLLLCCSVRPRLVTDNRSSSSSIRSWASASEEEEEGGAGGSPSTKDEEEADAVMSHLVLDDRTWFLDESFKDNKPLVVAEAAGRDPNDLFLSPLMAYTQNKHLAVLPVLLNGRRLGAFLLLFKSPEPPKLSTRLGEEVHQIVSGTEKDLNAWLSSPSTDAARIQLLLQSRWLKQRIKEWIAAVYSQESYNFYNPNRSMCAVLQAVLAQRRFIVLADVCQRCPWVQQLVDAVFYMVDVLLPMPPSKPLFALNAECASDLRRLGFRPPDLRAQVDSPVYTQWLSLLRAWTDQGQALELELKHAQGAVQLLEARSEDVEKKMKGSSSTSSQPSSLSTSVHGSKEPWSFSHRDVFDLIGKHKYDHTLPDLLSSLAAPQGGAFPWYDRAYAECLATKLAGSGAMRQGAALGVVTHYLYRTFLHPHELPKAWAQLHRSVDHLWAEGRPATAIFVLYKSVLEFLHPFHDGNGRFSRVVASVLLRRAGFPRALIHSENKILSLKEFFEIVTKEVSARAAKAHQRLQQLDEGGIEEAMEGAGAGGNIGVKEERSGSV